MIKDFSASSTSLNLVHEFPALVSFMSDVEDREYSKIARGSPSPDHKTYVSGISLSSKSSYSTGSIHSTSFSPSFLLSHHMSKPFFLLLLEHSQLNLFYTHERTWYGIIFRILSLLVFPISTSSFSSLLSISASFFQIIKPDTYCGVLYYRYWRQSVSIFQSRIRDTSSTYYLHTIEPTYYRTVFSSLLNHIYSVLTLFIWVLQPRLLISVLTLFFLPILFTLIYQHDVIHGTL